MIRFQATSMMRSERRQPTNQPRKRRGHRDRQAEGSGLRKSVGPLYSLAEGSGHRGRGTEQGNGSTPCPVSVPRPLWPDPSLTRQGGQSLFPDPSLTRQGGPTPYFTPAVLVAVRFSTCPASTPVGFPSSTATFPFTSTTRTPVASSVGFS